MASSQQQEKQTLDAASAAAASGHGAPPEEIAQAIEAAKTAASFQDAADALKKQASLVWDPAERERLLKSAYLKEKEAHGESKKARVMASGWGQGAGMGVGISAAVGMGTGNLLGALLSGVVAVPGALIGSGVGAIHGPFVKLKDMVSGNGQKAGEGGPDGGHEAINEKLKAELDDDPEAETDDEDIKAHATIVEAARKLESEKPAEATTGAKGTHGDAIRAGAEHEPADTEAKNEPDKETVDEEIPAADDVKQQQPAQSLEQSSTVPPGTNLKDEVEKHNEDEEGDQREEAEAT